MPNPECTSNKNTILHIEYRWQACLYNDTTNQNVGGKILTVMFEFQTDTGVYLEQTPVYWGKQFQYQVLCNTQHVA